MGGKHHRREFLSQDEAHAVDVPGVAAWSKASAETIVRDVRKRIAKGNIKPGERRQWFNLQMITTASAIAIGRANHAAQ